MAESKASRSKAAQKIEDVVAQLAVPTETAAAVYSQPERSEPKAAPADVKVETPRYELPRFNAAQFEVPEAFRGFAEKGVAQAREAFEQFRSRAEEATDAVEDTYETARLGLVQLQQKAIDAVQANVDATFQFAKAAIGAKNLAELVEIQAAFVRRQFEVLTDQSRELQVLAQKIALDTAAPARSAFEKAFRGFRAA